MVRDSNVTKFVGDHIVYGIHGCFNQSAIEHEARRRRHGPPSLSKLAHNQSFRAKFLRCREAKQVHLETFREFTLGLLPVPGLYKFACDFGSLRFVSLHNDEASDDLNYGLDVGNYLQPILTSKVKMGLARHILAIRRTRKELDEIPLLAQDPRGALAHLLLDSSEWSILRSSHHNRGIGLNGDFQCRPVTPYDGEIDAVFPISNAVSFRLHPGNRARARSMIFSSRSSITSTVSSMPRSSRRTSKK